MVKVPLPVHPVCPVAVHVPEKLPLLERVPCKVSTLFWTSGNDVVMVIWNELAESVAVSAIALKQGAALRKLKLVTVTVDPVPCANVARN